MKRQRTDDAGAGNFKAPDGATAAPAEAQQIRKKLFCLPVAKADTYPQLESIMAAPLIKVAGIVFKPPVPTPLIAKPKAHCRPGMPWPRTSTAPAKAAAPTPAAALAAAPAPPAEAATAFQPAAQGEASAAASASVAPKGPVKTPFWNPLKKYQGGLAPTPAGGGSGKGPPAAVVPESGKGQTGMLSRQAQSNKARSTLAGPPTPVSEQAHAVSSAAAEPLGHKPTTPAVGGLKVPALAARARSSGAARASVKGPAPSPKPHGPPPSAPAPTAAPAAPGTASVLPRPAVIGLTPRGTPLPSPNPAATVPKRPQPSRAATAAAAAAGAGLATDPRAAGALDSALVVPVATPKPNPGSFGPEPSGSPISIRASPSACQSQKPLSGSAEQCQSTGPGRSNSGVGSSEICRPADGHMPVVSVRAGGVADVTPEPIAILGKEPGTELSWDVMMEAAAGGAHGGSSSMAVLAPQFPEALDATACGAGGSAAASEGLGPDPDGTTAGMPIPGARAGTPIACGACPLAGTPATGGSGAPPHTPNGGSAGFPDGVPASDANDCAMSMAEDPALSPDLAAPSLQAQGSAPGSCSCASGTNDSGDSSEAARAAAGASSPTGTAGAGAAAAAAEDANVAAADGDSAPAASGVASPCDSPSTDARDHGHQEQLMEQLVTMQWEEQAPLLLEDVAAPDWPAPPSAPPQAPANGCVVPPDAAAATGGPRSLIAGGVVIQRLEVPNLLPVGDLSAAAAGTIPTLEAIAGRMQGMHQLPQQHASSASSAVPRVASRAHAQLLRAAIKPMPVPPSNRAATGAVAAAAAARGVCVREAVALSPSGGAAQEQLPVMQQLPPPCSISWALHHAAAARHTVLQAVSLLSPPGAGGHGASEVCNLAGGADGAPAPGRDSGCSGGGGRRSSRLQRLEAATSKLLVVAAQQAVLECAAPSNQASSGRAMQRKSVATKRRSGSRVSLGCRQAAGATVTLWGPHNHPRESPAAPTAARDVGVAVSHVPVLDPLADLGLDIHFLQLIFS